LKGWRLFLFLGGVLSTLSLSGCFPSVTYPAGAVAQSVEQICRAEYNLSVQSRVVGRTIGALFYTHNMIDREANQLSKEVMEQIGRISQALSRVTLSTDRRLDFWELVVRDEESYDEIVMTRSVEDLKKTHVEALSIDEYLKRIVFKQSRYHPQAEGPEVFVLKEVTLEDFLANQISQRIRLGLQPDGSREESEGKRASFPTLVDGYFDRGIGKGVLRFSLISFTNEGSEAPIRKIVEVIDQVLFGYSFTAYDRVEIQDLMNRRKLVLRQDVLKEYHDKEITLDEIMERYLTEAASLREALNLFNLTPSPQTPPVDLLPSLEPFVLPEEVALPGEEKKKKRKQY